MNVDNYIKNLINEKKEKLAELEAAIKALEKKDSSENSIEILRKERKKLEKKIAGCMDKTPESLKAQNDLRLQKFLEEKQNVLDDVLKRFDLYFNLI